MDEQKVKCPDYCPAGWIMCEQVTAESEGGKAVKAKAMNQNINLGHPSNWRLANRNPPSGRSQLFGKQGNTLHLFPFNVFKHPGQEVHKL